MNYGPLVFLAAFAGLAASWFGLVLMPQVQLGRAPLGTNLVTRALYPQSRPGLALQGAQVYRENGCMYCHSQQTGQTGVECNVVLLDLGTNAYEAVDALIAANVGISNATPPALSAGLPKPIVRDVPLEVAQSVVARVSKTGARIVVDIVPTGPDIDRGWGKRRSVAEDFMMDYPVMPGSLRAGPDLANAGVRLPDANWHLRHLYAPRSVVPGSPMPAYHFLFEKRKVPANGPSPDALQLPEEFAPEAGYEIVPKPDAHALVAYLLSLRPDAVLYETPMSVPAPPPQEQAAATNAPAQ